MSLKKLFSLHKPVKSIEAATFEDIAEDAESSAYVKSFFIDREKHLPEVDYSDPKNFAKFGLAKDYYEDSFKYIRETYPYDGSLYEKMDWQNSGSNLDNYIFDNIYPRTTGYAAFSPTGWGTAQNRDTFGDYSLSDTQEYILIKSGPNTGSADWKDGLNNIYDAAANREDNLKFDLETGLTVEFWLKKEAYTGTSGDNKTGKEVIFDMWNGVVSSSGEYGRLTIELTGTDDGINQPTFLLTAQSGTAGIFQLPIASGSVTTSSVADNTWKHYSLSFKNDQGQVKSKLFVNGTLKDTITTGSSFNRVYPVSGTTAHLGALRTAPSGTTEAGGASTSGWGKLSASVDEFRYWKTERTSKQIGRHWFTQVAGGSNTDRANTDLGVYYKFNEGITTKSNIDSVVMDYAGRLTNGDWTGYSSQSRMTDSAIESAGYIEFKDPIIRSENQNYTDKKLEMANSGSEWDGQNVSSLYSYFPEWISEEENKKGSDNLKQFSQIISSYFDEVSLYLRDLPRLKDVSYTTGSTYKPSPIKPHALRSAGFETHELFKNASIIEQLMQKDEARNHEEKLHNVRNFIYTNIYNNLSSIFKSKGTDRSLRYLLNCFGINEDIYKINLYADNLTYEFKDEKYSVPKKTKLIDFTREESWQARIYQSASATDSNSVSFISGSQDESVPITVEAEILFPKKPDITESPYENFTSVTSSLFGMHTADTANPQSTAFYSWDPAHFNVYAVRLDSEFTNKVRFVLTSSNSGVIPLLTSSVYDDVYQNSKWNFAVSVKPSSDVSSVTTDSDDKDYVVEFRGYNSELDIVNNSFSVTGTVDRERISHFMTSSKRLYLGAHFTDFTSSTLNHRTDARFLSSRVWMDYLSDDALRFHSFDIDSYGPVHPTRAAYLHNTGTIGQEVNKINTLALHWEFDTVTGSDSNGQFFINDTSDSDSDRATQYGWVGEITKKNHTAWGYNFSASSENVFDVDYIPTAKQRLPEVMNSVDMVQVMDVGDDDLFMRASRPVKYFLSIEKSMYSSISEEMLNMFASVQEFNDLIGAPVNKYRPEYKGLEKLRNIFFQRVNNTPDIEKYVNFYKWFDSSIVLMLKQLVPISARQMNYTGDMIESHILERNKYHHKFPTLESKQPDIEGTIFGVNELTYNWKFGHAPSSPAPLLERSNCLWWKERAERNNTSLTSGQAARTITSRDAILSASVTQVTGSKTTLVQSDGITTYVRSTYPTRRLSRPYKFSVERQEIKKSINKKFQAYKKLVEGNYFSIAKTSLGGVKDCDDQPTPAILNKQKISFTIVDSADGDGTYLEGDGQYLAPFNIYTSSAEHQGGGYNSDFDTFNTASGLEINDIHKDVYGNTDPLTAVLQGPFTEKHVGGNSHRHIDLNINALHTEDSRREGWRIEYDSDNIYINKSLPFNHNERSQPPYNRVLRDEYAKRPLNIRNIKHTASYGPAGSSLTSSILGNYQHNYQVVQTSGRDNNNLWFRSGSAGTGGIMQMISASSFVSGVIDYSLEGKNTLEDGSRNKTVFAERFSSPGGPEVMSRGALDQESETYSVYNALNYRNLIVRNALNTFMTTPSARFGVQSGSAIRSDDYLIAHTASYHKVHRNTGYKMLYSGDSILTSSVHDNAFVTHQIPRSPRQYAWITASLQKHPYGDSAPLNFPNRLDGYISGADGLVNALQIVSASHHGTYNWNPTSEGVKFSNLFNYRDFGKPRDETNSNSTPAKEFIETDFAGLNTNIYEEINPNTNTLGFDSNFRIGGWGNNSYYKAGLIADPRAYFNHWGAYRTPNLAVAFDNNIVGALPSSMIGMLFTPTVATSSDIRAAGLNSVILNRQGPYGWPSWKQVRGAQHPVVREMVKTNRYSVAELTSSANPVTLSSQDKNMAGSMATKLHSFIEPPVVSRYKPMEHVLSVYSSDLDEVKQTTLVYTHNNNLVTMEERHELPNADLASKVDSNNNLDKKNSLYNDIKLYYSVGENFDNKIPPELNPLVGAPTDYSNTGYEEKLQGIDNRGLVSFKYRDTIFPKQRFTFLDKIRTRQQYNVTFWRNDRISQRYLEIANDLSGTVREKVSGRTIFSPGIGEGRSATGNSGTSSVTGYETTPTVWQAAVARENTVHGTNSQGQVITETGYAYIGSATDNQYPVSHAQPSIWPLDARAVFATGSALHEYNNWFSADYPYQWFNLSGSSIDYKIQAGWSGYDGAGELQNDYCIYHNGNTYQSGSLSGTLVAGVYGAGVGSTDDSLSPGNRSAGLRPAALFNRRIPQTVTDHRKVITVYAGDTLWEAGDQAGKYPMTNTYAEWAEHVRATAKDYSIVPEYRISEYIDQHLTSSDTKLKNFGDVFNPWLSITGANIPDNSKGINTVTSVQDLEQDFYHVYSTSEFLKNFTDIKVEHQKKNFNPVNLKLTCKVAKKFLPYDGFYPAQRTVQLAQLFSQSYGPTVTYRGSQPSFRTALTPFFAPGILYNTIKSGIAVDYPINTSHITITGSFVNSTKDFGVPRIKSDFDTRVPFEAIANPSLLADTFILDPEPHPSASINCTASLSTPKDERYNRAIGNFLAEIPNFFLEASNPEHGYYGNRAGGLAGFKSHPFTLKEQDTTVPLFQVTSIPTSQTIAKEYRMRLKIYNGSVKSRGDHHLIRGEVTDAIRSTSYPSREFSQKDVTMYDRFGVTKTSALAGNDFDLYDNYGSSFGPAVDSPRVAYNTNDLLYTGLSTSTSASHEPYTPPYYDGYADYDIVLKVPEEELNAPIAPDDFLKYLTVEERGTFQRVGGNLFMSGAAGKNAMNLSASVNIELVQDKNDQLDNPSLYIRTKFETPVLDFQDSDITLPLTGALGVAKGMWHQYGTVPAANRGIYLELLPYTKKMISETSGTLANTGSLYEVCGFDLPGEFPPSPEKVGGSNIFGGVAKKQIGEIAQEKVIREAVVAIPFQEINGKRLFYEVPDKVIRLVKALHFPELTNESAADVQTEFPDLLKNDFNWNDHKKMIEKMRKYVFPPNFDFINNPSAKKAIMYVFEFEHKFDQKDLSDIWQNLPPDSLNRVIADNPFAKKKSFDTATDEWSHNLFVDNFFGVVGNDNIAVYGDLGSKINSKNNDAYLKTQWLVFKVKQKAKKTYKGITKFENSDVENSLPFTYNWPYDYFSMIEMAKIEAEVEFGAVMNKFDNNQKVEWGTSQISNESKSPVAPNPDPQFAGAGFKKSAGGSAPVPAGSSSPQKATEPKKSTNISKSTSPRSPRTPRGAPRSPRTPAAPRSPRTPRTPAGPRTPRAPAAPRTPRTPRGKGKGYGR